jgi:aminoglycoside N3'-acetyltransferase
LVTELVKVADEPAQTACVLAGDIETIGIKTGFTVTVNSLLVTVAGDGQVAVDVINTLNFSPLLTVLKVNV